MSSKYLFLIITAILQIIHSSGKEKDIYYVVNNGLDTNYFQKPASPMYSSQRPSLSKFNELFQQFMNQLAERVTIQLYYETMCMGCRYFDATFKETVIKLGSNLDVKLYPYGNAKMIERNGQVEIVCQHGPEECYGNKLHACAIDYLKNITAAVLYNSCMMDGTQTGSGSDDAAADVCGHSMGINSEPIKQCAKGDKGMQLLKYYGVESKKANFKYVPFILINGVENNTGFSQFFQEVCKAFKRPPAACNSYWRY